MRIRFDWKIAFVSIVLAGSVLLTGCMPASLVRGAAERLRESLVEATPTVAAPVVVEKQSVAPTRTATPLLLPTPVPDVGSGAVAVVSDEDILTALYERANRSVVNIAVVSRAQSSLRWPGLPGLPTPTPSPDQYQRGEGSGFVYDKQGHIITNNHVVASAEQVRVTFSDDFSVLATVVGADADSDLAVIKVNVDPNRLYPLPLGDSDMLRVGQKVVAIGNPFGLEGTMTNGIISGLGRILPVGETTSGGTYNIPDIVQTDAAINPGNSGGPLLNYAGEVVAVNTAIESPVRGFAGVGYAIPANLVSKVVPVLIEKGSYAHPWLGISGMTLIPEFAEAMKLPEDQRGILIGTVTPDGPAARAGLRGSNTQVRIEGVAVAVGGDVIVAVDGEPVRKFDDLLSYLARKTVVGQTITLTVLREGRTVNVNLTLAARPGRS